MKHELNSIPCCRGKANEGRAHAHLLSSCKAPWWWETNHGSHDSSAARSCRIQSLTRQGNSNKPFWIFGNRGSVICGMKCADAAARGGGGSGNTATPKPDPPLLLSAQVKEPQSRHSQANKPNRGSSVFTGPVSPVDTGITGPDQLLHPDGFKFCYLPLPGNKHSMEKVNLRADVAAAGGLG